jgi:hypothetical protein
MNGLLMHEQLSGQSMHWLEKDSVTTIEVIVTKSAQASLQARTSSQPRIAPRLTAESALSITPVSNWHGLAHESSGITSLAMVFSVLFALPGHTPLLPLCAGSRSRLEG